MNFAEHLPQRAPQKSGPLNPRESGAKPDPPPETSASETRFCRVWRLPNAALDEDWERIYVPTSIKERLTRYIDVQAWLASGHASDVALARRRTILLFGEPGTGKTSLARGLPNAWARAKAGETTKGALLLSINSHVLPSGERGGTQKNVLALFRELGEIAGTGGPTFIHLDEVESVGTNRADVNAQTNPLDTLYGVNAFIEGLDSFTRAHPNALWLLTSNLPRAIDRAVMERVDLTLHLPPPDSATRMLILRDALSELHGLCRPDAFVRLLHDLQSEAGTHLLALTDGFSARQLRHLIVAALTCASDFESLQLDHLSQAAQTLREQAEHHRQTQGVYTHDFGR